MAQSLTGKQLRFGGQLRPGGDRDDSNLVNATCAICRPADGQNSTRTC